MEAFLEVDYLKYYHVQVAFKGRAWLTPKNGLSYFKLYEGLLLLAKKVCCVCVCSWEDFHFNGCLQYYVKCCILFMALHAEQHTCTVSC